MPRRAPRQSITSCQTLWAASPPKKVRVKLNPQRILQTICNVKVIELSNSAFSFASTENLICSRMTQGLPPHEYYERQERDSRSKYQMFCGKEQRKPRKKEKEKEKRTSVTEARQAIRNVVATAHPLKSAGSSDMTNRHRRSSLLVLITDKTLRGVSLVHFFGTVTEKQRQYAQSQYHALRPIIASQFARALPIHQRLPSMPILPHSSSHSCRFSRFLL